MQYFFVDESGEPGLLSPKSSSYFVITMVQMPRWEPVPELALLRKELRLSPSFEFHYVKMSAQQKEAFYRAIRPISKRLWICGKLNKTPRLSQTLFEKAASLGNLVTLGE